MTIVAAALLLASAGFGDAAQDPVIDTASAIDQTQCAPCHLDLGSVSVPGLVFSHGNHLLVSCDACHSRMPHAAGKTERVPMEVCYACHGVEHGPQGELATSRCRDCHSPSFTLRPRGHVKEWAKKPHADRANAQGVNDCLMCHRASKDCDPCHVKEGIEVGKMPREYHSLVQPRPKPGTYKVFPKGPVSMAQCMYCHPDLDAITPGRLIFAHAAHVRRNYSCEACHTSFAHSESGVAKPDMMSCYRCHDVYHNGQGRVADGRDCLKCHPEDFELKPTNHTKKFIKGAHGKRAGLDPAYCAMCHQSSFCIGCHRGESVSPNAPGRMVIPKSHRKAVWKSQHGPEFLDGKGACGACHDDKSCKRCHKTVMPHPVGWIENHRPEPGVPVSDCNICHTNRASCQKCHHASVARAELVAKNCVRCHDEMKQKPATDIKNKGFAEHAVHFDVTRIAHDGGRPKDEPYTCDDCHIGFGTAAANQQHQGQAGGALPDAGHDVRLCYGCHGSVDYKNEIIAPWPGAALCLRCHDDLNL